jgi:ABC-type multidrug transport system fused ATPase/permease subunit
MSIKYVFDNKQINQIYHLILIAIFSIFIRAIFNYLNNLYSKLTAQYLKEIIRKTILLKLFDLGPIFLSSSRSGKIQSLILDGIESLEPFIINYIPQMTALVLTGLGIGIYLSNIDLLVGFIIIISMIISIFIPYFTVPKSRIILEDYWSSYSELNSQYIDAISGITTLKSCNASSDKAKELANNAHEFYHKAIDTTAFSLVGSSINYILIGIISLISVAIAAYRTEINIINLSYLPLFLFLTTECSRPINDLNNFWHSSLTSFTVISHFNDYLNQEIIIKEIENPDICSLNDNLPSIEFKNVDFYYDQSSNFKLKNINLMIDPGFTAAFVGHSGAGKSTLLYLILRFFDVLAGEIKLNGQNIINYNLEYLRKNMAVVFQDTYLFHGTIEDNIRLSLPEATLAEVMDAAKAANCLEFISCLPNGFQTIIGERGLTLSGGERQRLAIARAMLKRARLILLDEATSSVDARSETLIQSALANLSKKATTVVIAHRLSTIQNADVIFVLNAGNLAEFGTHDELMERHSIYYQFINAQINNIR